MPAATQFREERAELEAILGSGIFARSPSLASFLQYVCEKYFEGQADTIKEYNVAVEALGRPANFDQKKDSIVRVEAHRLRKRLHDYYKEGPGASHSIHISIPSGNYVPQFRNRESENRVALEILDAQVVEVAGAESSAVTVTSAPPPSTDAHALMPSDDRPRVTWRVIALAAALLVIVAIGAIAIRNRASSTQSEASVQVVPIPLGDEVRILAGSPIGTIVDHYGQTWHGDQFYDGGEAASVNPRPIARSQDPSIFYTRREGTFTYNIPVKPGNYEVHLYFAETLFGENNIAGGGESTRLFHALINGKQVLFYFDVIADAGGANTANVKVFKDIQPASDGRIHVTFQSTNKENAFVNAIEILPAPAGRMRPVRIVARDIGYVDKRNMSWSADRYFTNGLIVKRHEPVANTEDDELYRSERYGNFSYTIPVAEGSRYSVTLKFCESWFGAERPGGGGSDSRLFDVYVNGRTLLHNFDVFKEAGGNLRAYDKTFRNLEPNAQGKLIFQFVPVRNYAMINGIEVIDEGS